MVSELTKLERPSFDFAALVLARGDNSFAKSLTLQRYLSTGRWGKNRV
jgi:hypothetical protein